jgi:hypothetical protein
MWAGGVAVAGVFRLEAGGVLVWVPGGSVAVCSQQVRAVQLHTMCVNSLTACFKPNWVLWGQLTCKCSQCRTWEWSRDEVDQLAMRKDVSAVYPKASGRMLRGFNSSLILLLARQPHAEHACSWAWQVDI